MNKWMLITLSIALALSFALVYALSPNDDTFLARYTPEEYITVASFDVPLYINGVVDAVNFLSPFTKKKVRMDIDKLEIRVNRNIAGNLVDFMKENLDVELFFVPETYERINIIIDFPRPVRNYTAETFSIVRLFGSFRELLDNHVEILICVPMNYTFAE